MTQQPVPSLVPDAPGPVAEPSIAAASSPPPKPRILYCPRCQGEIPLIADGPVACPSCRWRAEAYLFDPVPLKVEAAAAAMPEDATCLFHPTKRATAVCSATGDYICALCAIEIKGQVYSASYLNNAGKEKVGQAFDRYLERPDNTITTLIICCFIPYVNFVVLPTAPIWIPYAVYLYIKALRMRRENPLYARIMDKRRVIMVPIWLGLFTLVWLFGLVMLIMAIMGAFNR